MKDTKHIVSAVKNIFVNIRREHIGAFAAQSAFFLIMSFFPLIFLVLTVLKTDTGFAHRLSEITSAVFPYVNKDFIKQIFLGIAHRPVSLISFSTLLAAWSAGKSFYALSEAFRCILSANTDKNYIFLRLRGLLFSVGFVFIIAVLFIVGVFGENINNILYKYFSAYRHYAYLIMPLRKFFVIFALFVVVSLLYIFLPDSTVCPKNKKNIIRHCICAFVSAIVIYLYTVLFSAFADIYIKYKGLYGGISTFISVMLWLYGSMYIIIIGFRLSVLGRSKHLLVTSR